MFIVKLNMNEAKEIPFQPIQFGQHSKTCFIKSIQRITSWDLTLHCNVCAINSFCDYDVYNQLNILFLIFSKGFTLINMGIPLNVIQNFKLETFQ